MNIINWFDRMLGINNPEFSLEVVPNFARVGVAHSQCGVCADQVCIDHVLVPSICHALLGTTPSCIAWRAQIFYPSPVHLKAKLSLQAIDPTPYTGGTDGVT